MLVSHPSKADGNSVLPCAPASLLLLLGGSPRYLSQREGSRKPGQPISQERASSPGAPHGFQANWSPGTLPAVEGQSGSGPGGGCAAWMPRGHHAAHWPWGFPPHARTSRSVASDFRELLASLSWVTSQGGLLTALSFLSVPLDMVNWASVNKRGNDAKGPAVVERPLAEPLWNSHCVRGARGLGRPWPGEAQACQTTQDSFLSSEMMSSDFLE